MAGSNPVDFSGLLRRKLLAMTQGFPIACIPLILLKLGAMSLEQELTADGSITYFNSDFGESYHSKHGAYREALEKHVQACKIPELVAKQNELKILDFCFGLGYNSAVAIAEALKVNPEIKIEIIALENDREILEKITQIDSVDFSGLVEKPILETENYRLELLLDDARLSIDKLDNNYFDAIFFDPFSPKVCPELWQPELIAEVVAKARPGAHISTYSNSRVAKDGFSQAGCKLHEGPKCGRRNGGVLALK